MATSARKRRKIEHVDAEKEMSSASSASSIDPQNEEDSDANTYESEAWEDVMQTKQPQRTVDVPKTKGRAKDDTRPSIGGHESGAFKSNIFKLQVDELLAQIRPRRGSTEAEVEGVVHKLRGTIEKLPTRGPASIEEAERQLLMTNKVAVPFPDPRPPKDAKYKLEFAKPSNVNITGSFALGTAIRRKRCLEVDMIVTMPSPLFLEKDFLNYRYFYKRAYYIACIAAGLRNNRAQDFQLKYKNSHDDPLKPILTVSPNERSNDRGDKKRSRTWQINIIPCISPDVFPQNKLLPDKNNVRSPSKLIAEGDQGGEERKYTPTYNSALRSDMLMSSYLKLLHSASKTCTAYKDACLLGSTWLRQRGLGSNLHAGGFGSFELCALMALLLQGGGPGGRPMLSEGYSSYQLLKATLQLLAVKDYSKSALVIGQSNDTVKAIETGVPLVWDAERSHNVLYKMSPWSYKLLRRAASTTLSMLSDQQFDGFEATFVFRTDCLLYSYDYCMRLNCPARSGNTQQGDFASLEGQRKLYDILKRGLGDRMDMITISPQWFDSWEIGSAGPGTSGQREILVCFTVKPENVDRTVDHGPSAENKKEAALFRDFWGEKAELRRFKDGSILESIVWTTGGGSRPVVEQIVRHVLKKHFGDKVEEGLDFFGQDFGRMLRHTTGLAAFQPFVEGLNQLENEIRALEGLPLAIRQIMPADSQLRYSSVALPLKGPVAQPADVVIQFEGSTRWPDDLVAIQRMKIAILLKLTELLQESVDSVTARVGLENGEHDILNQAFSDIVYDSGTAFRLRIHHDREQTLLERRLKDQTLDPSSKEVAALGLGRYKRDYVKTPAHTQAIAQLCRQHPAMSGAIRLVKKWFAAHLLCNHVADEVIELLVARTFTRPWPWQTPSSIQTGFLRTLFWLSRWHWRGEPLIVDLSGSGGLKTADVRDITTKFEAWRNIDPSLNRVVLFAASNIDPDGTTWTDGQPSKVVAGRMTALATAACAEVEEKQLSLEPGSLFSSSVEDFDFVIHLEHDGTRKKPKSKSQTVFKNLELDTMEDNTFVSYNASAELLHELERTFGAAVLFFSGGQERPVIAGLWQPQTAERPWKLNLAYSTLPKKAADAEVVNAEINKDAILGEIARLGGDLIHRIEKNRG